MDKVSNEFIHHPVQPQATVEKKGKNGSSSYFSVS